MLELLLVLKYAILLFGVFTGATSVIMIRGCQTDPVALASYRQLIAALVLAPLFVRDLRRFRGHFTLAHLRRTIIPGVLLGGHFIAWIYGARMTFTGNANLIVNLVPVAMPFLLFFLARERLNLAELAGTALAVVGAFILAGGDYHLSGQQFEGDLYCFLAMLLLAAYLALGRRNRDFPSIWLYIVPLYAFGGLFCLLTGVACRVSLDVASLNDLAMAVGLALIPTVLGHTIYNAAMKWFRGAVVGITGLSQFIFGAALGWLWYREVPGWSFYIAAALVVAGALVSLRSAPGASADHAEYTD